MNRRNQVPELQPRYQESESERRKGNPRYERAHRRHRSQFPRGDGHFGENQNQLLITLDMEPRVVRLSYKIEKGKLKELTRNTLIFQFIFERYKDVRKFGSVLENTQY
jgi:hypothetical protein